MPAAQYRHEYVSASVSMGPIITGTVLGAYPLDDPPGYTTEFIQVQLLRGVPSDETILSSAYAVDSLQAGGYGLGAEAEPGIIAWEMWWARIFTTSLNLVPTLRFHVEDSPSPIPQFFLARAILPSSHTKFCRHRPARPPGAAGALHRLSAVRGSLPRRNWKDNGR